MRSNLTLLFLYAKGHCDLSAFYDFCVKAVVGYIEVKGIPGKSINNLRKLLDLLDKIKLGQKLCSSVTASKLWSDKNTCLS